MPASFLGRHRTICAVLEEISESVYTLNIKEDDWEKIAALLVEAKGYAQSMSNKLLEYKQMFPESLDETSGSEIMRANNEEDTAGHIDGYDRDDLGESPDY